MCAFGIPLTRAIATVTALFAAAGIAVAEPQFDITSVPRIDGATEMIVAGPNVLYVSPETPDETGKKLRALLQSSGWFHFDEPPFEDQDESDFRHQEFIRGGDAINVYVTAAPAKNNRTSVQYSVVAIPAALPIPKDATRIAFSTRQSELNCFSLQKAPELLEFYATELSKTGWQRWTMPNIKMEASKSGAVRTHFVSENKKPLLLKLSPLEDGTTYIALESVTHEEMMVDYTPRTEAPIAKVEAKPAPAPVEAEEDSDEKFAGLVQGLIKEAMKPVAKTGKKEAAEKAPVLPIAALANNTVPLPLPEDAKEIEHDEEDGTLEFHSAANVPSLTAFYREQMKALGWKEKRGVLNSDRLQGLDFSKGKSDRLNFTIHNMSDRVDVTVRGDSLKVADSDSASTSSNTKTSSDQPSSIELPAEPVKQYALSGLEVTEQAGLPVPTPNNSNGRTKSKFFYNAMASVQASVETIVAFYRRELPKRDWKEDAAAASISADAAKLQFTSKEGPAVLKVAHKDGQSNIELTVRQKAQAEASGLMPKAGYVRILFGNIEETPGEITIGGKTFKVKPGERAEDPKLSPSIELKPGKHAFTVKSKGKPAQKDEHQFGADEIWGILIGPGGGLPLPMYQSGD